VNWRPSRHNARDADQSTCYSSSRYAERREKTVHRVLQFLLLTILIGTLLVGRCLPCRDLYAKSARKSCCDKSGACTKLPAKGSKTTPCAFQQNAVASEKVDAETVKVSLSGEVQFAVIPALVAAAPLQNFVRTVAPYPEYSPPLLYILHERFLI
jgi:hypothetical protein